MERLRLKRVGHLIQEKISNMILHGEVKDPRIDKLVSIIEVKVTNDLKYARVYTSFYGEKEKHHEIVEALNHAAGFIQSQLGKSIRIKNIPRLTFIEDDSIERGFRITEKLKGLL